MRQIPSDNATPIVRSDAAPRAPAIERCDAGELKAARGLVIGLIVGFCAWILIGLAVARLIFG